MNKYKQLYIAANELMAKIGRDGEINAHQDEVGAVMNALFDIDGGAYDPTLDEFKGLDLTQFNNR